jgi:mannosyltransferase
MSDDRAGFLVTGRFRDATRAWLLPALLLLLALSLRCYRLGAPSLWMDEGYSLQDTGELSEHGAYRPLYFFLLRLWAPLGSGEAWLRTPSALASAGSVLLLFFLARRLAGTRAAALAALIMALSAQELDHAQEVRMYAPGALLSLGAVALLWSWHQHRRLSSLAGHLVAAALALAMSPAALLLVVPAAVYAAWHERREPRDLAWLAGAWLALLAALLPLAPAAAGALARLTSSPHPSSWPPVRDLASLPAQLLLSPVGFLASAPAVKVLFGALAACCLAVLALAALPRDRTPALRPGRLLVAWFALPCIVMFVLARTVIPLWTTRYFLALGPVFYLALALGLERARQLARGLAVALATFVLAVMAVRLAFNFIEPQREDWRATVAYLNDVAMPGDVVLTGGRGAAAIWSFYDRSALPTADLWAAGADTSAASRATAEAPIPRHRGRTLVLVRTTQRPAQVLELPNLRALGGRLLGSYRSGWVTALVVAPGGAPPPVP